jgi:phage tail protein X
LLAIDFCKRFYGILTGIGENVIDLNAGKKEAGEG